jgi:8-oxo-dGTP diphosphatase
MKQVVAALIVKGDKLLACQRTKHQVFPLRWEFPGGKIEAGEGPTQALVRELEEELGIHARIGPQVARIRHTYNKGSAVELFFFIVETYEGEIDNRIFRDVRWVDRSELPGYDFLDADRQLVRDIATGKVL